MLPLSDDNRGRHILPVVTWALIALNVVVYLFQSMMDQRELMRFFTDWAVVPAFIADGEKIHTLITSAFLHGSWFHLGSNMLFLWIFGDNVEDVMGHVKFLAFYLICAVAASMAQVLIDTDSVIPMVGASGAVSGLLAAYVILFPKGRVRTLVTLGIFITIVMLPAVVVIGLWFVLQLVSGFMSLNVVNDSGGGVAFFAHIGGFVAGLALVMLFRDKQKHQDQLSRRTQSAEQQTWGIRPGR